MTRAEHIKICKERAFQEFDFYKKTEGLQKAINNGLVSMGSDLRKHPETNQPAMVSLCISQVLFIKDETEFRKFINGFAE